MHLANVRRWRSGSSGRPLTPRRGAALGLLERSARAPAAPSGTDGLIVESARHDAQVLLARTAGAAGRLARRSERFAARATDLRERAAVVRSGLVRASSGAAESTIELRRRHDELDTAIAASLAAGEQQHRRAAPAHRRTARLLPWIDGLLFAYFVSGVSNADLAAPWTTPLASLVALAFTAFLVLTVAAFSPWLGRGLRPRKGVDGELRWAELGPATTALLALWTVLTLAIGVTMFVRVQAEAGYAGAEPWTGGVVAGLLALASVAMNGYVLGVACGDGSPAADDLRSRGEQLCRVARRSERLLRRAGRCDRRRVLLIRRARRLGLRAQARAEDRLAAGERTVELVHLRTGVRSVRPRPPRRTVEDLDQRELAGACDDVHTAPFE